MLRTKGDCFYYNCCDNIYKRKKVEMNARNQQHKNKRQKKQHDLGFEPLPNAPVRGNLTSTQRRPVLEKSKQNNNMKLSNSLDIPHHDHTQ